MYSKLVCTILDVVTMSSYEDQCKEAVFNKDHDKVLELLPLLQNHDKIVCKVAAGLLLTLQYLATYLSDEGTYLLHMSALYGWLTIVQLLVTSYNCSPLQKDTIEWAPLHYAALGGHLPVLHYFINDCNCDAMIANNYGSTPLHKAALNGHLSVVQYFINDCKCDAMIANNYGSTPLHMASLNGHLSVVQYFINDCKCDAMIANNYRSTPLHMAALNGHISVVQYLNDCKCDAMITSKNGWAPLHGAAENGHLSVVQYFINDCKCDAMITNKDGWTPLHMAAQNGHLSVVQYFINDCNCDAMVSKKNGWTPLHSAARNGHLSVVQYLIDCKCDAMITSKDGWAPLHGAAENGHLSVVQYFINDCKCDAMITSKDGWAPLHGAAENGHLSVVQYFINDCKCDAMITNKDGWTPLHMAAQNGHLSVVQYFINDCNCDAMVSKKDRWTPLHSAALNGHLSVVQYLIDCKCDAMITSKDGWTPLHGAAENGHLSVVQYFINDCKCDAMIANNYGSTPLHMAALNGHLSVVQYFINDCKCDAMIANNYGSTPLHMAALNGHISVVQYFINDCKCDAVLRNKNGSTPLHVAAQEGHLLVVQYFIDCCHCEAIISDRNGSMSLHYAARKGHLSVVKYFINDCNCDAMITNKNGSTPLHYAAQNGHLSVVRFLNDHNCDAMTVNKYGSTPLHYAAQNGHLSVVQYFINDCNCNAMIANMHGATPLHIACQYNKNSCNIPVIQYLLSIPSVLASFTAATNYASLLLSVKDFYNRVIIMTMYEMFQQVKVSHPVGLFVNILFLGNAGAGKTTLCEVIKSSANLSKVRKWTKMTLAWMIGHGSEEMVQQVQSTPTAGIVPDKLHHTHLGNVIIHDFAGHQEYYSSHSAVLEDLLQQCGSVFVVLINLTQNLSQQIQFWLNNMYMYINGHQKVSSECYLIVIGSHADEVEQSQLKNRLLSLERCASNELSKSGFKVSAIFNLDCRLLSGGNLEAFISKLSSLCASIRNKQSTAISLYCNFLYSLLEAHVSACTLPQLIGLCDRSCQKCVLLPDDILPLLKTLHSIGLIIYLENEQDVMKSWIIVKKKVLLTDVNGILFAPSNFIGHADHKTNTGIANNTGVITTSALHHLFPQHSVDMLISFLKSMKLCEEFDDTLLKATNLIISDANETLLFFPALIAEKRPQELNGRKFTMGWCYRINSGILFSVRFLHVLLLQLAYRYALQIPVRSTNDCPSLPPGLQRRCFVWINGIHWYNANGIEIIVEVENKQCVIVLIRSFASKPGTEEDMVQLHCELIHTIISLQREHCPTLECTEYLIDPSELHYPCKVSQLTCYSMETLISCSNLHEDQNR